MSQRAQTRWSRIAALLFLVVLGTQPGIAGISRAIQERYRKNYENKALFLKLPLYAEKQYFFVSGKNLRSDQGGGSVTPRFKVGDQIRVLNLDFGGDEIRFKLGAIGGTGLAEVVFKFQTNLQEDFPNREEFDAALAGTFTEGLKFSDIEEAKKGFVDDQFERIVRDLAATTSTSREFVLRNMVSHLPSYQDALRDIENLKGRNQDLAGQVNQLQSDNRRLELDLRQQQNEVSRLKTQTASLQEKIDNSSSQLSKLGEDLRTSRGMTQTYQSQLANLQRSLNLKVDENRDLASQISDLGQALKKLQNDNESLEIQTSSLRINLEDQKATNKRLSGELEDIAATNRQMKETIDTLTSKEDSLARQYLQLKQAKEHLEDIASTIENLTTRTMEEKSEGGIAFRKIQLFMRNILLGSLEWRFPESIAANEQKSAEVRFAAESIDYVRLAPDERRILHSLGERLKLAVKLVAPSSSMEVTPEKNSSTQEVGERDQARWRWRILNRGTQDIRLGLAVSLVNRNNDEIPVLAEEHLVASSNMVRQVRTYLQPIPLAVGACAGFLLFGIVSLFRRGKKPAFTGKQVAVKPTESKSYLGQKQL